ncbi:bag family molecular chaperone regulator 8 chloroplastic [Phtheirospermum japonicum]|uniref:Bag family molecular chaperone regulator 8 chloroplastic n=1 Tax=Phtheirospermum japonicum TaxID=374723 RepID=A0A830C4Y5_9LAMI|nr:bag family molecular chaperone regulator 8 chloroplastic [Phtheirospermum japonicum]
MAFHHHHPAAACYCHCCYPTYTTCHHHLPPPPPDCHLRHPPHQPYPYSGPSPNLPGYHDNFQESYVQEKTRTQDTVSSLLRRIAALESALRRRASATPFSSSQSLRDAAARTIQTHFRAFLLCRSITLRQLKDLAAIKSTLGFLKSSVSEKTHLDYDVVYHEAMNLLLKLDSIQGGDPMVRNGKTSLIRELNKILDFIDGVYVERGLSNEVKYRVSNIDRKFSNAKCGESKRVNIGKLRGLVERVDKLAEDLDEEHDELIGNPNDKYNIRKNNVFGNRSGGLVCSGVHPKVKKNVSFADYCDDDSTDRGNLVNSAERELDNDDCREIEEIGNDEDESSLVGSDGDKYSRSYSTSKYGNKR